MCCNNLIFLATMTLFAQCCEQWGVAGVSCVSRHPLATTYFPISGTLLSCRVYSTEKYYLQKSKLTTLKFKTRKLKKAKTKEIGKKEPIWHLNNRVFILKLKANTGTIEKILKGQNGIL